MANMVPNKLIQFITLLYGNLQAHRQRCVFMQMMVGGSIKTQLS
jgi:hypothetical protein